MGLVGWWVSGSWDSGLVFYGKGRKRMDGFHISFTHFTLILMSFFFSFPSPLVSCCVHFFAYKLPTLCFAHLPLDASVSLMGWMDRGCNEGRDVGC